MSVTKPYFNSNIDSVNQKTSIPSALNNKGFNDTHISNDHYSEKDSSDYFSKSTDQAASRGAAADAGQTRTVGDQKLDHELVSSADDSKSQDPLAFYHSKDGASLDDQATKDSMDLASLPSASDLAGAMAALLTQQAASSAQQVADGAALSAALQSCDETGQSVFPQELVGEILAQHNDDSDADVLSLATSALEAGPANAYSAAISKEKESVSQSLNLADISTSQFSIQAKDDLTIDAGILSAGSLQATQADTARMSRFADELMAAIKQLSLKGDDARKITIPLKSDLLADATIHIDSTPQQITVSVLTSSEKEDSLLKSHTALLKNALSIIEPKKEISVQTQLSSTSSDQSFDQDVSKGNLDDAKRLDKLSRHTPGAISAGVMPTFLAKVNNDVSSAASNSKDAVVAAPTQRSYTADDEKSDGQENEAATGMMKQLSATVAEVTPSSGSAGSSRANQSDATTTAAVRITNLLGELTATVSRLRLENSSGKELTIQLRPDVLAETNIHIVSTAKQMEVSFLTSNTASNDLLNTHITALQNHLNGLCPDQVVNIQTQLTPASGGANLSSGDQDRSRDDLASFDQGNRNSRDSGNDEGNS